MIVLDVCAVIVALCALLALGNVGAISNSLTELARIAQREHGIREQDRARRDEAKVARIERGPCR
jgi:hypothetical protein